MGKQCRHDPQKQCICLIHKSNIPETILKAKCSQKSHWYLVWPWARLSFSFFSLNRLISAHLPPCCLCRSKMDKQIKQHPVTPSPWRTLGALSTKGRWSWPLPCKDRETNESNGHGIDPLICICSCSPLGPWNPSSRAGWSVSTSWLPLTKVTTYEAMTSLLKL